MYDCGVGKDSRREASEVCAEDIKRLTRLADDRTYGEPTGASPKINVLEKDR